MIKRVRDGSITLDDYDAQSLEVPRQVATGLFMTRMDHLIRDDYASNPLLNDLVIDRDDELGVLQCGSRFRPIEFFRLFHTCNGQCSQS